MKDMYNIKALPIRENSTSKTYFTGAVFPTNNCGEITVIGQVSIPIVNNHGNNRYRRFIVGFSDGTQICTYGNTIPTGAVKNPNHPSVYAKGFIGIGPWEVSAVDSKTKKHKATSEYDLWNSMLGRCYDKKIHKRRPTYKDCTVDERWYDFQVFCEDIKYLERYATWRKNKVPLAYHLDKDIKIEGNKVYSKDTCVFISVGGNNTEMNKRTKITSKTYIATRISDGYIEEFTNQAEFAVKYNLHRSNILKCIKGTQSFHKDWLFEIKDN